MPPNQPLAIALRSFDHTLHLIPTLAASHSSEETPSMQPCSEAFQQKIFSCLGHEGKGSASMEVSNLPGFRGRNLTPTSKKPAFSYPFIPDAHNKKVGSVRKEIGPSSLPPIMVQMLDSINHSPLLAIIVLCWALCYSCNRIGPLRLIRIPWSPSDSL
jgi:hypothetical protein